MIPIVLGPNAPCNERTRVRTAPYRAAGASHYRAETLTSMCR